MIFDVRTFRSICFKTSQDAEAMGVIYSCAIRLYGALTVPRCAKFVLWFGLFFLSSKSEKTQNGGYHMSCSTVLAGLG